MNRPRIPPITSYAMPRPDELPDNIATWSVDPARVAVLVHDMQEFFLRGFDRAPELRRTLVANCARLVDGCRAMGAPIGYTAQPGSMTPEQRGLLEAFWGPGMSGRNADRGVVPELAPAPDDAVFTKWRYSAFHSTGLERWLAENGRDQLVICGVYAHIGVLTTALDSFSRDIETFLVSDAIADFSPEYHRLAIDYAARNCAVVQPTTDIVAKERVRL
jgi:trans-2,3-dihydro-3-hydroxyanthranilic acid synthase